MSEVTEIVEALLRRAVDWRGAHEAKMRTIQPVDGCGCWTCDEARRVDLPWPEKLSRPFIVCPECGNKRCPRATHHDHDCTGSNDSGQVGSRYGVMPDD